MVGNRRREKLDGRNYYPENARCPTRNTVFKIVDGWHDSFFFFFLSVLYAKWESLSNWRCGKIELEINYVVGFSFSYMDLLFYFLDIKICKKISSYLSDNENFIVAYRL